jgi:hypothetical protein
MRWAQVRAALRVADDRGARVTARGIQITLGVIWMVDGVLQFQPYMFTRGFLTDVLLPAAQGQPAVVGGPMRWTDHLIAPHLAAWNVVFALIQVAIGVGLLVPNAVKPALVVSFAWSALVWWLAEGFGGLFNGSATPVTGLPGSAASGGLLGDAGGRLVWAAVWVGGALLCLLPVNWQHNALSAALGDGADGEPGALAWLDRHAASLVAGNGLAIAVSLCLIQLIIAAAVLGRWHRNTWLVVGVAVAVCFWVFGQNLGEVFTWQATDPNTGPLLVLLAVGLIDRAGTVRRAAVRPIVAGTRRWRRARADEPGAHWCRRKLALLVTQASDCPRRRAGRPLIGGSVCRARSSSPRELTCHWVAEHLSGPIDVNWQQAGGWERPVRCQEQR